MTCEDKQPPASDEPVLVEPTPSASAPADVKIAHVQLRDLIVCPFERGVVWYVGASCIIEHDILDPLARPRVLARLTFTPVTLTTLPLPDNRILLAAGGQDRELFLALYKHDEPSTSTSSSSTFPSSRTHSRSSSAPSNASGSSVTLQDEWQWDASADGQEAEGHALGNLELQRRRNTRHGRRSREIWQHCNQFDYPASINNSVMLYIPPAPHSSFSFDSRGSWPSPSSSSSFSSASSSAQANEILPRLVVSNNDRSVKFLDVSLTKGGFGRHVREGWFGRGQTMEERQFEIVGNLILPVPVNHTTVSPDGSTLLSCGDSSSIYLHRIISKASSSPYSPSTELDFEPLITLSLPPSPSYPTPLANPYLPYAFVDGAWTLAGAPVSSCFATAWNRDGSKFAVASQEGMVLVWDVRSGEPLQGGRWETVRGGDEEEKGKLLSMGAGMGIGAGVGVGVGMGMGMPAPASGLRAVTLNGTWTRDAEGEWVRDSDGDVDGGMGMDDLGAWYANRAIAPSWGVRVLKFAKNASGREVLVFTEHASKVHVIDADTFATHDVIRIPHVPLRKPLPPSPSPPAVRIADAPAPVPRTRTTTTNPAAPDAAAAAAEAFERERRAFMAQFSAHERSVFQQRARAAQLEAFERHVMQEGSSSGVWRRNEGGYLSPGPSSRGYRSGGVGVGNGMGGGGGTRPMAIGGTRHTSTPPAPAPAMLSPGRPFSRSPETIASELHVIASEAHARFLAARSNGLLSPDPAPEPEPETGLLRLPPQQQAMARRRRRAPVIPAFPPGGLTARRSTFESGSARPARTMPMGGGEARVRVRAAGPGAGAGVEDAVMEEDIAWHMILDAIEREDVEMASEQDQDRERERDEERDRDREAVQSALEIARANATDRLREAFFGRPPHPPASAASPATVSTAAQDGTDGTATEAERAEARFLSYLRTLGLQLEGDGESSTVVRLGSAPVSASSSSSGSSSGSSADGSESPGPGPGPGIRINTSRGQGEPSDAHPGRPGQNPDSWEGWWDFECTSPGPEQPLFSVDLTRAASVGATGSGSGSSSSTDAEMIGPEPEQEVVASTPELPQTQARDSSSSSQSSPALSQTDTDISLPPAPTPAAIATGAGLPPFRELIEATQSGRRLDIAGVCFAPGGAHMYVATVDGITEWTVRGTEVRWWGGGGLI